jgi:hypothetical protein
LAADENARTHLQEADTNEYLFICGEILKEVRQAPPWTRIKRLQQIHQYCHVCIFPNPHHTPLTGTQVPGFHHFIMVAKAEQKPKGVINSKSQHQPNLHTGVQG